MYTAAIKTVALNPTVRLFGKMTAVQIREKKQPTDKQYTQRTEGNITKMSINFNIQTRSRMAQVHLQFVKHQLTILLIS